MMPTSPGTGGGRALRTYEYGSPVLFLQHVEPITDRCRDTAPPRCTHHVIFPPQAVVRICLPRLALLKVTSQQPIIVRHHCIDSCFRDGGPYYLGTCCRASGSLPQHAWWCRLAWRFAGARGSEVGRNVPNPVPHLQNYGSLLQLVGVDSRPAPEPDESGILNPCASVMGALTACESRMEGCPASRRRPPSPAGWPLALKVPRSRHTPPWQRGRSAAMREQPRPGARPLRHLAWAPCGCVGAMPLHAALPASASASQSRLAAGVTCQPWTSQACLALAPALDWNASSVDTIAPELAK
ncbi:hypothetical protein ACCO45_005482 [Purpureocillium lilacinum]|uniref:Uncharacterized protein n=1 Tax=Purpureocillium lilacinum TaxID=33203 RepID=A0ACC4DYF7_PURLI